MRCLHPESLEESVGWTHINPPAVSSCVIRILLLVGTLLLKLFLVPAKANTVFLQRRSGLMDVCRSDEWNAWVNHTFVKWCLEFIRLTLMFGICEQK